MREQLAIEMQTVSGLEIVQLRKEYENACRKLGQDALSEKLSFAVTLIRSPIKAERAEGLYLLRQLRTCQCPHFSLQEILFFLAKGYYWNEEYPQAMESIDGYLQLKPNNRVGVIMRAVIADKIGSDAMVGVAIVGGAAAVLGLVALGVARAASR